MNLKCMILSERKLESNGYILYDSIYMMFSQRKSYRDKKQISGCQGLGVGGGD